MEFRIADGRYQAMLPAFISGWDGNALPGLPESLLLDAAHIVAVESAIWIAEGDRPMHDIEMHEV